MDRPKKRPEKREDKQIRFEAAMWNDGYNKAIDDYETWLKESLPSEEEILAIIDDITLDGGINPEMAEAISKSIIGK